MSNDNKTMEQVALSDRPLAEQLRIIRDDYCAGSGEFDALDEAADVVECNQREIAGLKGERKGILKANESLAADNTRLRDELAAKDAEIAQIKACLNGDCNRLRLGAEPCPGCHIQTNIDKIDSLQSLVKEMADALDNYPCHNCKHGSERCEWCGTVKELDALVAKAREDVK